MRVSKMHLKTLREVPAEAEISSHILLIRSGMIRKLVSGVYGFMPMGWKSIRKIEKIIREEMDSYGAQEIHMSALQPAELWKESGRWSLYGPELWRLKDRNQREFCLGPTHEEIFTDIVRNDVTSYRQMPLNLYQIQTKYRDEARPRFGLMRSREFIMKDSYSFDKNFEDLDKSYNDMYKAYENIFSRCGLKFRAVEADTGAIGGSNSHEFTAISSVGESEIAYCEKCNMAATTEKAECVDDIIDNSKELELEKIHTPNLKTIDEVSNSVGIRKKDMLKALIFVVYDENQEKEYVVAFIRGDRELNLIKLVNALNIPEHAIEFAESQNLENTIGAVAGFTGPMGLHDCKVVVDTEVVNTRNLCAGAGEKDYHIKNVNYGRDFEADIICDIKLMQEGDVCPNCGNKVKIARGIEVGQVFKLGTKYSDSMKAYYKDENQCDQPIVMGCYGIGVTRTLAAIIEQHNDENGIIWPVSVAPYEVIVTVVNINDENQMRLAEKIYGDLSKKGIEVILDDRKERPGVKFKDADLLGIPVRITVGKGAVEDKVEYKLRREEEKIELKSEESVEKAINLIISERKGM